MPGRSAPGGASTASRPGGLLTGLMMLGGLLLARSAVRWLGTGHASHPPRVSLEAVTAGHETRETPMTPVVVGGVAVLLGIGAALIVATWFQAAWVSHPLTLSPPPGLATPVPPPAPPEPRLEEVPGAQLRAYRAAQERLLRETSWLDRESGTARIPIDRAIDLLSANPPPARPTAEASQSVPTTSRPPSGASSGRMPTGSAP